MWSFLFLVLFFFHVGFFVRYVLFCRVCCLLCSFLNEQLWRNRRDLVFLFSLLFLQDTLFAFIFFFPSLPHFRSVCHLFSLPLIVLLDAMLDCRFQAYKFPSSFPVVNTVKYLYFWHLILDFLLLGDLVFCTKTITLLYSFVMKDCGIGGALGPVIEL